MSMTGASNDVMCMPELILMGPGLLSPHLWRSCKVYAVRSKHATSLFQSRGRPCSSWTVFAYYSALVLLVMKMAWPQVIWGYTQQERVRRDGSSALYILHVYRYVYGIALHPHIRNRLELMQKQSSTLLLSWG